MIKVRFNLGLGIMTGIVLPPFAFLVFYLFGFPGESLNDVLRHYIQLNVITHVISLSVLTNLAAFFLFLRFDKEQSAKGVIGATILYAFLVLILKLIG